MSSLPLHLPFPSIDHRSTLNGYRWVCQQIESVRRRTTLSVAADHRGDHAAAPRCECRKPITFRHPGGKVDCVRCGLPIDPPADPELEPELADDDDREAFGPP